MNRIKSAFQKKQKGLLNIYFTAGYPRLHDTVPLLQALATAGADLIEIGMPFSDPLADGPVIQASSTAALHNGMNMRVLFSQLQGIRESVPDTPILLMGYLNPVMQFGVENFCREAAAAGVDGVILPDLPLDDYVQEYQDVFRRHKLRPVFLITPQTAPERIRRIDELTDSFLYLVSGPGTTGGANTQAAGVQDAYFQRIEDMKLRNPRLIGFGIGDKASFQHACRYAEGAIIGSAFIRALDGVDDVPAAAQRFVQSVVA
ncbi:tryptophan synthase subunit alpha [Microvirga sp. STR05]|uniref:Tryptophan synthase alpha chain n=1 Tax=Hymenobacter duratus TaxID=2771356 RepID=A0ABR8JE07_9BACT|nr:tryptophan synthase subunit alpha [Hymenobacter duratus]MBD2715086.1 tryptophan synthase subunit alpha [Hymenobacter duratus]MBR7949992.1 tryptophan synthase subunit alpha [Microvirga sp. STR05]